MANVFMCSIEKDLGEAGKMPSFYHRFVDDTITTQRDLTSADAFLSTLNSCHPSISLTMEVEVDGKLPFLGMEAVRNERHLEMKVYVKPTNKGLLLQHDSHVDERYKRSLIQIKLHRAFRRGNISLKNVSDLSNCFVDYSIPKHWLTTQSPSSSPRRMNNQTLLLLLKRENKAF